MFVKAPYRYPLIWYASLKEISMCFYEVLFKKVNISVIESYSVMNWPWFFLYRLEQPFLI